MALGVLTRRAALRQRHRWDVVLMVVDAGYGIGFITRFGQTLGQMVMGIRIVDAKSQQPPPWTRAMIRWAVAGLPFRLASVLPPSRSARRIEELKPEIQRLQREQRDDPRRRGAELRALYRANAVSPSAGILRALVTEALADADLFLAARDASRRGLADRAANTVVIRARPTPDS